MARQMEVEGPAVSGERDIVAAGVFDAPRELVFRLWTEPEHVVRWWGPTGFTTTIHAMDVRPGGWWLFVMHGPDGRDYSNEMTYVEVERPQRLVMEHGPTPRFLMIVEFLDRDGGTEVRVVNRFESAEARDRAEQEYGAVEGLGQTLDRLGAELAAAADPEPGAGVAGATERSADAAPSRPGELRLSRFFDAPRALVFRAWTEPERFARWWGPRGVDNPVCELDARPGGEVRWCMRAADGMEFWHRGEFREVVAPERLVFTLRFTDAEGRPAPHPGFPDWSRDVEFVTTITLEERAGGTRMSVHQVVRGVDDVAPAGLAMERRMAREGWLQSFDKLAESLAEHVSDGG